MQSGKAPSYEAIIDCGDSTVNRQIILMLPLGAIFDEQIQPNLAKNGFNDALEYLWKKWPEVKTAEDLQLTFKSAMIYNRKDTIKLLQQHKLAAFVLKDGKTKAEWHEAAFFGDKDKLNALKKIANTNPKKFTQILCSIDAYGNTPLQAAIYGGDTDYCEFLFTHTPPPAISDKSHWLLNLPITFLESRNFHLAPFIMDKLANLYNDVGDKCLLDYEAIDKYTAKLIRSALKYNGANAPHAIVALVNAIKDAGFRYCWLSAFRENALTMENDPSAVYTALANETAKQFSEEQQAEIIKDDLLGCENYSSDFFNAKRIVMQACASMFEKNPRLLYLVIKRLALDMDADGDEGLVYGRETVASILKFPPRKVKESVYSLIEDEKEVDADNKNKLLTVLRDGMDSVFKETNLTYWVIEKLRRHASAEELKHYPEHVRLKFEKRKPTTAELNIATTIEFLNGNYKKARDLYEYHLKLRQSAITQQGAAVAVKHLLFRQALVLLDECNVTLFPHFYKFCQVNFIKLIEAEEPSIPMLMLAFRCIKKIEVKSDTSDLLVASFFSIKSDSDILILDFKKIEEQMNLCISIRHICEMMIGFLNGLISVINNKSAEVVEPGKQQAKNKYLFNLHRIAKSVIESSKVFQEMLGTGRMIESELEKIKKNMRRLAELNIRIENNKPNDMAEKLLMEETAEKEKAAAQEAKKLELEAKEKQRIADEMEAARVEKEKREQAERAAREAEEIANRERSEARRQAADAIIAQEQAEKAALADRIKREKEQLVKPKRLAALEAAKNTTDDDDVIEVSTKNMHSVDAENVNLKNSNRPYVIPVPVPVYIDRPIFVERLVYVPVYVPQPYYVYIAVPVPTLTPKTDPVYATARAAHYPIEVAELYVDFKQRIFMMGKAVYEYAYLLDKYKMLHKKPYRHQFVLFAHPDELRNYYANVKANVKREPYEPIKNVAIYSVRVADYEFQFFVVPKDLLDKKDEMLEKISELCPLTIDAIFFEIKSKNEAGLISFHGGIQHFATRLLDVPAKDPNNRIFLESPHLYFYLLNTQHERLFEMSRSVRENMNAIKKQSREFASACQKSKHLIRPIINEMVSVHKQSGAYKILIDNDADWILAVSGVLSQAELQTYKEAFIEDFISQLFGIWNNEGMLFTPAQLIWQHMQAIITSAEEGAKEKEAKKAFFYVRNYSLFAPRANERTKINEVLAPVTRSSLDA